MGNTKVKIEATVSAAPKKVWTYWNDPKHIVKWNFAVYDWIYHKAKKYLRVSRKHKSTMEAKDGRFVFDFEGTYDEVMDEKKIAYTIADGRRVETIFESKDGKTTVSTTFDAENQNPVQMQK